ncbi:MAG TPA: class I SAM-dependent rRNA methyltransferase, partial [Pirellulaceae bacterium]|nr:class I SAM-dependent rRNA methyltransferase [Pirellulaceae bacterium]
MNLTAPATSSLAAARVILRPQKALPFYGRHPWVLESAVERVEPTSIAGEHLLEIDGAVVDLVNDRGKFIARGFYNSQSRIRVRLLTWNAEEALDEAFFRRRIEAAIELRRRIGYPGSGVDSRTESGDANNLSRESTPAPFDVARPIGVTRPADPSPPPPLPQGERGERNATEGVPYSESAARLVFSEADGLSGLVVDRYGDYLALQPTSLAMAQRLEMIVAILHDLLQPRAVVLRAEKSMAQLEGVEIAEGHVWGELPEGPITIREHGLVYEFDLHVGQKTGFYLDQRENRRVAATYVKDRRVLDMFCYTGGFAMAASALGGSREVLAIDSSKKAIALAQRNAELNGLKNVTFEVGDGFQTLDALLARGERFEAVILDPPKFARGKSGVNKALMAYHRLNRAAVELLVPGGILITCSCTGSVSREDFLLMLSGVAQK